MAAGSTVGLAADLKPWRQGIRKAGDIVKKGLGRAALSPFNRAIQDVAKNMRKRLGGAMAGIRKGLMSFKGLLAAAGLAIGFRQIARGIGAAIKKSREFNDSLVMVESALAALPDHVRGAVKATDFEPLRKDLVNALGLSGADVNRAISDFMGRGFDPDQARKLTVLAANTAKKVGRPVADVQRQIADAVNGNVAALKRLGIEIPMTGDKVRDGQAAVEALVASYGDVGAALVNPSEQLRAQLDELWVFIGDRLAPIFDPLVQKASDFVTALLESEEGRAILEKVTDAIASTVEWIGTAINRILNFTSMLNSAGKAWQNTIKAIVQSIVAGILTELGRIPGLNRLLDIDGAAQKAKDAAAESAGAASKAFEDMRESGRRWLNDESSAVGDAIGNLAEQGRAIREASAESLSRELDGVRADGGFAGRIAQEEMAARASRAQQAARDRARQQATGRADARGSNGGGVVVRVSTIGDQRFDRGRLR